ncbi:AAA family ATPase [Archangium sp. Cb G35]|uniref:AAA family ATPase n=1 Tax=Archangium sp. Cb G35 TaxID=1920190 RepID=UPI00093709F0|nr:AAA family ATPase [Archangium sp. Cb G35]
MKLKIEKLGRIQRAEIDVRPLTVLIGPNNTNKTWTAYAMYGLLQFLSKKLTGINFVGEPGEEVTDTTRARLKEAVKPFIAALNAEPTPSRLEYVINVLHEDTDYDFIHVMDHESIYRLLGVRNQGKSKASASLRLSPTELATSILSFELVFEKSLNRLEIKTNRRRTLEDGKTEDSSVLTSRINETWTEQKVFEMLHSQFWNRIEHVIVFPAERNGILPIWPLITVSDKIEIPFPVVEFARFLGIAQATAPVGLMNSSQSHLSALLKKVLGGEIAYVSIQDQKRLVFRTGNAEVPLQVAASLSRAVAGLSIYIERFFQPDDTLIIDELEMNAHPQAQVALTEFIAALVNAGVRVVLTTHSPYVVDHLNNLMEASRAAAEKREELAQKFTLKTPSSFISPEKVAVHAFQEESPEGEVTVREVLNRQTGLIDWSTFSRVSEHITNLYSDILRSSEEDT